MRDDPGIVSVKHAPKRRRQDWLSGGCFPPAPRPSLFVHVHQSVHDAFVRLETRGGHVYNRRVENIEQEGREHAPLTKALFHSEPPRAHPAVEPHACSHAIVELMNDRDQILWHAKTSEYCPEEGSINGVVRFGQVDRVVVVVVVDSHIQRIVLATEETAVTQQVSHRRIKCQSRLWSQRGTKVNGSHHGDNPLLRPAGIKIATKSYAALQAMAPTNIKTVHQTSLLHIESNLDQLGMLSPTHDQRSQQKNEKRCSNQF